MPELHHFFFFVFALVALVWFLFQKKMLDKKTSEFVSKLYFYPTFPITAMLRLGNYWTQIDETVCIFDFLSTSSLYR
jgi:tellurite resistance protein TehA-like permease